jgi:heme oxygenase
MSIDVASVESQPSSSRSQPSSSRSSSLARTRAQPRRPILERLKLETESEHSLIESATGVMDPGLDLDGYRAYLERTFGFYQVVEAQLRQLGVWEALRLPALEREKLPLLAEDLVLLGNLEPTSIPVCDAGPAFPSTAEAVGGAYVLEGSTLGGRVISRHVRASFGPDVPRAFLECYGATTGEKWRDFGTELSRFATSREIEDQIIAGARETFRAFTRWLQHSSD